MYACTKCGWTGCNLVPRPADNTAGCPDCGVTFRGIPATDFQGSRISTDVEDRLVAEARFLAAGGLDLVARTIGGGQ